jgi:hypothetical protein
MQLCFKNNYSSPLSVAVMWYDTSDCGGEGGNWANRGWWNLSPGETIHTDVWTANSISISMLKLRTARYGAATTDRYTVLTRHSRDAC